MNRNLWLAATLVVVASAPGWGRPEQTMRASIRGGGGDHGKCTIELDVDEAAEVAITGDRGVLRTLAGAPATWRRFECNQPMPREPREFSFHGVDGRGDVALVQQPRRGRPAVVRIRDPRRGREGYTFDIEWRGGNYHDRGYR